MAYSPLITQDFRYGGDPFQKGVRYYGRGGLMPDYDPSQGPVAVAEGDNTIYENPEARDHWIANDDLVSQDSRWGDRTQMEVVSQDENGDYIVKLKTADKEGTLVKLAKDRETGEYYNAGVVGKESWDTNAAQKQTLMGIGSVIAAPFVVGGLQAVGALGQGTMGSLVGEAVGQGSSLLSNIGGVAGAGSSWAGSGTAATAAGGTGTFSASSPIWSQGAFDPLAAALGKEGAAMATTVAGGAASGAAETGIGSVISSAAKGALNKVTGVEWLDKIINFADSRIGSTLISGALKVGTGLYADSKNREAYTEYLQMTDKWRKEDQEFSEKNREDEQAWRTSEREAQDAFQKSLIEEQRAYNDKKEEEERQRRNKNQDVSGFVAVSGPRLKKPAGIVGSSVALGG